MAANVDEDGDGGDGGDGGGDGGAGGKELLYTSMPIRSKRLFSSHNKSR